MVDPEQRIDSVWNFIQEGMFDFTPDETRAKTFMVERVSPNHVVVLANMNSSISIPRSAFISALQVLIDNNATQANPLRIGSSNNEENSLELCLSTKAQCNGTRVINYIAPILLRMGIVGIGHDRPNTIWR